MDLSLDWVEAWNHSNLIDVFEDLRRDHFTLGFHVGFSQSPISLTLAIMHGQGLPVCPDSDIVVAG